MNLHFFVGRKKGLNSMMPTSSSKIQFHSVLVIFNSLNVCHVCQSSVFCKLENEIKLATLLLELAKNKL